MRCDCRLLTGWGRLHYATLARLFFGCVVWCVLTSSSMASHIEEPFFVEDASVWWSHPQGKNELTSVQLPLFNTLFPGNRNDTHLYAERKDPAPGTTSYDWSLDAEDWRILNLVFDNGGYQPLFRIGEPNPNSEGGYNWHERLDIAFQNGAVNRVTFGANNNPGSGITVSATGQISLGDKVHVLPNGMPYYSGSLIHEIAGTDYLEISTGNGTRYLELLDALPLAWPSNNIPEPSSVVLLVIGGAIIGGIANRNSLIRQRRRAGNAGNNGEPDTFASNASR